MEKDALVILAADRAVAHLADHKEEAIRGTFSPSYGRSSFRWPMAYAAQFLLSFASVTTFLMVALEEGKGVNAYARAVGIDRSSMSRYLRDIGAQAKNGGPGLGLVKVEPHPTDPQRCQVFLTDKGRSVSKNIFQHLRRTNGGEH